MAIIKRIELFDFFLIYYSYTGIGLSIEMTSRVHFIFNRGQGGSGQSLTDTSMNGTWIDKMRVGKGNKAPLSHGNIISVLDQGMEVFCYLDKMTMERDFHPYWLIVNFEYLLIPHV